MKRFVRTFQLFLFEAEQYFFSSCLQRYIDASSIMMQMPSMDVKALIELQIGTWLVVDCRDRDRDRDRRCLLAGLLLLLLLLLCCCCC